MSRRRLIVLAAVALVANGRAWVASNVRRIVE
jgi:hypothetical protein